MRRTARHDYFIAAIYPLVAAIFFGACVPPRADRTARESQLREDRSDNSSRLLPARILNQQGVRSYIDGRYSDALHYFEQARQNGGPASELWNIARCQQHLERFKEAVETLTRYQDDASTSKVEREEAQREILEMRTRPSRLTVLSTPIGAAVFLDENVEKRLFSIGKTPLTMEIPQGRHKVTIDLRPGRSVERNVVAEWGYAVIVEAQFSENGSSYFGR